MYDVRSTEGGIVTCKREVNDNPLVTIRVKSASHAGWVPEGSLTVRRLPDA